MNHKFLVVCDARGMAGLQHDTPSRRRSVLSPGKACHGAKQRRYWPNKVQIRDGEGTMGHLARVAGAVFLACLAVAGRASAESVLSVAAMPEEVGLSSGQLARIKAVTQKHIDSGVVPGAVMLVARRGKIAWYKAM